VKNYARKTSSLFNVILEDILKFGYEIEKEKLRYCTRIDVDSRFLNFLLGILLYSHPSYYVCVA
jgi:hypothetical protein